MRTRDLPADCQLLVEIAQTAAERPTPWWDHFQPEARIRVLVPELRQTGVDAVLAKVESALQRS